MDLSKLSTEDLVALQSGDLSKVSTAGLASLQASAAPAMPASAAQGASGSPVAPAAVPTQPPAPSKASKGLGAGSDFVAGLGASGIKTYLGLKQLVTGLNPENKAVLKELEDDMKERSGWADAGKITGDLAQFAIPGAKIAGNTAGAVMKLLPRAGAAAAIPAAGFTSSAAQEFLTNPVHENNLSDLVTGQTNPDSVLLQRTKNALKAGGMGAVVNGALGLAGKGVTQMFKPSVEAQNLMDQGMQPTLQQGADSGIGKFMGGLTSGFTNPKGRQAQEEMAAVMKRVLPGQDFADARPGELVDAINHGFKGPQGEYTQLYAGKQFSFDPNVIQSVEDIGNTLRNGQNKDTYQEVIQPLLNEVKGQTMSPSKFLAVTQEIQDYIDQAAKEGTVQGKLLTKAFQKAKDTVEARVRDTQFSPDELAKLADIDKRYTTAMRITDAIEQGKSSTRDTLPASKVLDQMFKVNPGEASSGVRNDIQREILDPANSVMKPMSQDEARVAKNLFFGKAALALGVNAATSGLALPPYLVSAMGQTKTGSKLLFGNTDTQRKLAELIRNKEFYKYSAPVAGDLYEGK